MCVYWRKYIFAMWRHLPPALTGQMGSRVCCTNHSPALFQNTRVGVKHVSPLTSPSPLWLSARFEIDLCSARHVFSVLPQWSSSLEAGHRVDVLNSSGWADFNTVCVKKHQSFLLSLLFKVFEKVIL